MSTSSTIDEMITCFIMCDRLDLIEAFELLFCVDEDDECLVESEEEEYEILTDSDGFVSLA